MPPVHTQFQKGTSGNPNGRPKGSRNLATVLAETLNQTVEIVEDGAKKTVTKLEAAVSKLVSNATGGDIHAFRTLSALMMTAEDSAEADGDLAKEDRRILEGLMRRFAKNAPEKETKSF